MAAPSTKTAGMPSITSGSSMRQTKSAATALERLDAHTPANWTIRKVRGGTVVKIRQARFAPVSPASALAKVVEVATQPLAWGGLGLSTDEIKKLIQWNPNTVPRRGLGSHEETQLRQVVQ